MPLLGAYDFSLTIGSTDYRFVLGEDEQGTKAWSDGLAPVLVPQVRDTAFGYDHTDPAIDLAMAFEQWEAGAGWEQAEHPHDPLPGGSRGIESHRYHYSQHVDLSWHVGVKSPEVQTGATTVAAVTKFLRSQQLGHFAAAGRYIRYWNGSAWSESDDAGSGLSYSDIHEYANSTGIYLVAGLGGSSTTSRFKYAGPVISHRATSNATAASGTSVTVTKPTGTVDDDILVATLAWDAEPGTVVPPSGWTEIHTLDIGGNEMTQWYKRASSEGASYGWSWDNNVAYRASIGAYDGCVTSGSPIGDSAILEDSSGDTAATAPALDADLAANTMLIIAFHGDTTGSITHTPPSGFTERADIAAASQGTLTVADGGHALGPAASVDFTASVAEDGIGAQIALLPDTTITWTTSTLKDDSVVIKYWTIRGVSSGEPVLYGITGQGALYSATDPTNSGALTGPDRIGTVAETVNGMTTIDDTVYVLKAEGIYSFDGTNSNFLWPAKELRSPNSGKHHIRWRNKRIYVNYGNQIIEIAPDNSAGDRLRSVFPPQGQYASPELNGEVTAMAPTLEWIWFNVENADGNNYLWKGNPETGEYHTVAYFGSTNCTALLQTEGGATDDGNQFHATNDVMLLGSGTNGNYLIQTCLGETPWNCSAYRFETTQGVVYGPFVDFGTKAYPAFLSRGEMVVDDVDADDTIVLQYQLPGGTATTIVTADDTTVSSYDVVAADEADEVEFSTIRYVLLMDNGAATTTPVLKGLALHASPVVPRKRIWQPVVRFAEDMPLEDGARSTQSVTDYLTALSTAVGSRMTLTDIWGSTYTVRLLDFQSQGARRVRFGDEERWEATYRLVLAGLDTLT